jgi:hypothetical protein
MWVIYAQLFLKTIEISEESSDCVGLAPQTPLGDDTPKV